MNSITLSNGQVIAFSDIEKVIIQASKDYYAIILKNGHIIQSTKEEAEEVLFEGNIPGYFHR